MKTTASTLAALLFGIGCVCFPPDASARAWTSVDGRTIEADFVRINGDAVVVLLGGKTISIPLSSLSAADQQWAMSQKGQQPAQIPRSTEIPKLIVQHPGGSGNLTRINVSVPFGYSGPPLILRGPDGKEHAFKVLDASKLPIYFSAVTELHDAIKALPSDEAKENKDKILGLYHRVNAASEDVGIKRLCNDSFAVVSSYGGASAKDRPRIGSFTTAGGQTYIYQASPRDDRSSDEKRSDPFAGPLYVGILVASDEKESWEWTKDLIEECLSMLRKLKPDDRFVYIGFSFNPDDRPEDMAQFGVWRLIADGNELDTVKAGMPRR